MIIKSKVGCRDLSEKIVNRTAKIGVIGLGYVGLSLVLPTVKNGFSVIGIEKKEEKVSLLDCGKSYITGLSDEHINEMVESGRFQATSQIERIGEVDIVIICVPTPISKNGTPDMHYVQDAVKQFSQYLKEDTLIILESTTYPGTTRDIVYKQIEKRYFKLGEQVFVAYSPERIDPGNSEFTIDNTTKVVGGLTQACTQLAKSFYETAIGVKVHTVSKPEVAEIEKLLENTFRQVNIGLINELSKVCHKLDIDVWEVVQAASTKPYGYMAFTPGPGIGGHCIPIDPQYLSWSSEQVGLEMSLITGAKKVNDSMPAYIVSRIQSYLEGQFKTLKDSQIVLIGAAYKPNVNDLRESPAIKIIELLEEQGCRVQVVDPFIEKVLGSKTVPLKKELIKDVDGAVIITNHSVIDYELLDANAAFIFDTRNTNYHFENQNYYKL